MLSSTSEVNAPTLLRVLNVRIRFAEAHVPLQICGQIDGLEARLCLWLAERVRSPLRGHLGHQRSANHSKIVTYGSSVETYDRFCVSDDKYSPNFAHLSCGGSRAICATNTADSARFCSSGVRGSIAKFIPRSIGTSYSRSSCRRS